MTNADILADNLEDLQGDIIKWVDALACNLVNPASLNPYLLALIALKVGQTNNNQFGSKYYRITPFNLTTDGQIVVDKEPNSLVRKVIIVVDSAISGPTPQIRVGTSKSGAASGGIRINSGQGTELGDVHPLVQLWAASSTPLAAYVIEYA